MTKNLLIYLMPLLFALDAAAQTAGRDSLIVTHKSKQRKGAGADYTKVVSAGVEFAGVGETSGIGLTIDYSQFVDKNRRYSAHIGGAAAAASNLPLADNIGYVDVRVNTAYYAVVGVSYYPWGNNRRVSISGGIDVIAGYMGSVRKHYDSIGTVLQKQTDDYLLTGILFGANMTINPPKHVVIIVHFGVGPLITGGNEHGPVWQIGCRFGPKF